jgi:hypothetical protein
MDATWTHQLEEWHEFFLLCGTAGVTLTGVLFIVISLGPSIIASENTTGVRAFISPNAVYFTTVLVVSNVLMAPDISQELVGWLLCIGAALSIFYLWSVKGPQRWRENGLSVLDWIWYIGLPYLAYALALVAGIGVLRNDPHAILLVAGIMIFMLVIGIRNAWDLAVWIPLQERNPDRQVAAEQAAARRPNAARRPTQEGETTVDPS